MACARIRGMSEKASIHNDVGGTVKGGVVQAGSINGEVRGDTQHACAIGSSEVHQAGRDQYHVTGMNMHVHLPSQSTAVPPRQLPPIPKGFSGRSEELAELTDALDEATGPGGPLAITAVGGSGGIGKTWLALYWAHKNAHRFPDGQLFVDLRGFDPDGTSMPQGEAVRLFLDALGVHPQSIPADTETWVGRYRSLDRKSVV